ncbi:MAG: UDP-N-acetylmuramate dehydrogenase [Candidatus Eisenbacteria bacterium]|nr:UDP-N-acetylmuramate dehydrogenase [Candidatus Eisenbacteria bacterium]
MSGLPPRWERDVPLRERTSWRVGGPVQFISHPADLEELREDLALARRGALPVFALGGGSNLLVSDRGYAGLMLRLPDAPTQPPPGARVARALLAAGASLSRVAEELAGAGWAGLEWAAGIPGTVGGAVVNNAGAFGGSIDGVFRGARLLDPEGREQRWTAEQMAFAYRHSALKGAEPTRHLLLEAEFALERAAPERLRERIAENRIQRRARTPRGASCGSVFRNPPGVNAGRLIAASGLAGTRRGDAQISTRHANYILNLGCARAEEILALIRLCRQRVRAAHGIELQLEVQLVGFSDVELG